MTTAKKIFSISSALKQRIQSQHLLYRAAAEGHEGDVGYLLASGIDPDGNNPRTTPLLCAAEKGFTNIARLLLEAGATVDKQWDESGVYRNRFTALHLAAMKGHLDMVRLLLGNNANINHPGSYGKTPLHLAVDHGRIEIVKILLTHNPKADVNALDVSSGGRGVSPLGVAIHQERKNILPILIAAGARPTVDDLCDAMSKGCRETIRCLIAAGAPLEPEHGKSGPIHYAARSRPEIMRMLLDAGADVNARDPSQRTALHLATRPDMVKMLLDAGADVTLRDHHGSLPDACTSERTRHLFATSPRSPAGIAGPAMG